MERFVLTDAQWAKMEPLCLGRPSAPGRSGQRLLDEVMDALLIAFGVEILKIVPERSPTYRFSSRSNATPVATPMPSTYTDMAPLVRSLRDAFGAQRLMWASDTTRFRGRIGIGRFQNPATLEDYPGKHSYAESLLFIRENEVLSPEEKQAILGGTAARVLDWA